MTKRLYLRDTTPTTTAASTITTTTTTITKTTTSIANTSEAENIEKKTSEETLREKLS